MENKQPENQTQSKKPTEFKTNTARYILFEVFLAIICLMFVNTPGFAGIVMIAVIASIPSTSKLLFHFMTIRDNDIEYKLDWLNIRRVQIPFDGISTVDTRISVLGSMLGYGTIIVRPNNSNVMVRFKSINNPDEIKHLIEQGIAKAKNPSGVSQPSPQFSKADELSKYADLKEKGVITQEEFDTMKQKVIGD
jgi:hypothetical protein